MKKTNKRIIQLIIWGTIMIMVIMLSIVINKASSSKNTHFNVNKGIEIKVYDGSENNPYIEGVQ